MISRTLAEAAKINALVTFFAGGFDLSTITKGRCAAAFSFFFCDGSHTESLILLPNEDVDGFVPPFFFD